MSIILPGSNDDPSSVRSLLLNFQGQTFKEYLFRRSQFSRLAGGMPQRSYGAFPSNNGHGSSFNSTRFAAPGPTVPFPQPLSRAPPSQFLPLTPRPMVVSTKKRTSERNRGLVVLVVIVLLQVALIAYRSNTLAKSIDLRSKIQSAPRERSALVAERDRSEREREKMRHDRELWEKMPEDHVPPGAHWGTIKPVSSCLEYGKREYFGMLQDIPEGWSAVDACRNTPAEIKGVTVRRPYRCQFVDGSPHIHGYWIVDWDPKDCRPWPKNIRDTVSSKSSFFFKLLPRSYVSGVYKSPVRSDQNRGKDRGYTGFRLGGNVRKHSIHLEWYQLHESYSLRKPGRRTSSPPPFSTREVNAFHHRA